ncbi:hypothetical protein Tco_0005579 [Tanacetum coccineum]
MDDTRIFGNAYDDEDVGADADLNNLETTMNVSPIPTTRIDKDHPKDQIIRDFNSAIQTRRMTKIFDEHAMVCYINKQRRTNHKDYQNCLFACFLSQMEPKKVIQALEDPSWIEAMQEELLQFQLQKVWTLLNLRPYIKLLEPGMRPCLHGFRRGTIDKTLFIKKDKASTPMEPNKALIKDEEADSVDVHLYRSMIGSLMYLTTSRPDIMFVVCACARFQVTPKMSHLHAVKRIFRYLKGQPKLGLWYPRDSPFDLEAFSDSDYAGASLDMKSTTGGCQFLGKRLISWQCKKQTIVANSTIEAEYVAATNCCGQVLWIQNQMLDYGFNFMNTKIYIDNESTIYETVYKEWEDRMERAVTTASSLDAEQDSVTAAKLLTTVRHNLVLSVQVNAVEVKAKTVNGERQLQALVDKKKVIITETSIRSDLYLEDAGGTDCLPTATIFEEPTRMGRKQKKNTEVPHPSDSTANVPNEESVPTHFNDPLLSGEDRLKLTDLMDMCTKLSERVGVIRRVEYLDDESLGAQEDASNQGRSIEDIDKDAEVSLVDETQGRSDDAKMFNTDAFIGNEVFAEDDMIEKDQDVKQRTATTAPYNIPKKRRHYIHREAGESTTRTPTSVRYKYNQLKSKSYDEIQKLFDNEMKRVNTFIPMDSEVVKSKEGTEESSKRTEDELESDKSNKAESSEKKAEGSRKKSIGKKRAGKEQKQESSKRKRMEDDKETDEHEEADKDDEAEMKKHMEVV